MKTQFLKSAMKLALLAFICFAGINVTLPVEVMAENVDGYIPLDATDPVEFGGTYIKYQGETITLSENAIYIDGSLNDATADKYDYVYNDFVEAAATFKDGTDSEPMKVYIAPYVYWIDDPDDPAIRQGINGDIPYGLIINCENLHLIGLTQDAYNVVLAVNRGQTQGAKGNYTMFYFDGNGLYFENLTMGNYCNVDLDYPLKPELSRTKRADAITQAQLALTNGDKIVAKNCNFLSRLNACPLVGSGGRILFKDCHIECGDDALPGTAVYMDCTLGFYSSKPFYNTTGTGAVFLNCDITSYVKGTQYLTKAGGTVSMIDCSFKSDYEDFKIEWTPEPGVTLKCIQANITLNGTPYIIDGENPYTVIDLTNTEALNAFRIKSGDTTIYNTYNLLQGTDGWDPLGNKAEVSAVGEKYIMYPYIMNPTPTSASGSNGTTGKLSYVFRYFRNVAGPDFTDTITWSVGDSLKDNVAITVNDDGTCSYTLTNTGKKAVSGMIYATSSSGFTSGTYIKINPETVEAPTFATEPSLTIQTVEKASDAGVVSTIGAVSVDYALATDGEDISVINWYRCDEKGENKIHVATSRLNEPEYIYELTPGDVGYYIMAEVTPKEENSNAGTKLSAITDRAITVDDTIATEIITDFQNFSVDVQKKIIPGFWTVAGYKPLDTAEYDWKASEEEAYTYGSGEGGATGTGLLQAVRGSRILYTPMCGTYGDMTVKLVVDPCKSAGQGFGSATAQYMDVYIKMDNKTLNGYALRIERTSKYSNGVDFTLIKYTDGNTAPISDPVSASCYNSTCTIELSVIGTTLTAHVETTHEQSAEQAAAGLAHVVDLSAEIEANEFGGSGVLHTGTVGANATMLHQMDIKWDQTQAKLDYEAYKDYLFAYTKEDIESETPADTDNNSENTSEGTEDASEENTDSSSLNASSEDNTADNANDDNDSTTTIIIIVAVAVIMAGITAFVIINKKKATKKNSSDI